MPGIAPVSFTIQAAPQALSSLAVSVATDQASYHVGSPVTITITETNTGNTPAAVEAGNPESVSITRNGVEVWRFGNSGPTPVLPVSLLEPGTSRQFTVVWPGRFTEHARQAKAGAFIVRATVDGTSGASAFRIIK
jgi:hypothetical protein